MNSAPDETFFMRVTPFRGASEVLGHPRACPSPVCERVVTSLPAQSYRQFSSNKESSKCTTRGPATTAATRPPSHCRSTAPAAHLKNIVMKFPKKIIHCFSIQLRIINMCMYIYQKHPIHSKMHLPEVNNDHPRHRHTQGHNTPTSGHRSGGVR